MKTKVILTIAALGLAGYVVAQQTHGGLRRYERITEVTGSEIYRYGQTDRNASYLDQREYLLVFFSASWCPHCRDFTPYLRDFYTKHQDRSFEVLLVPRDRREEEMQGYYRGFSMPWPAVPFDRGDVIDRLGGWYAGPGGIPNLVLVDRQGRVLSSSYSFGQYRGPYAVLADLEARWR